MEQIVQLKAMRDAALERLQVSPDFKLVNSLDALISDLEAVMVPQETSESIAPEPEEEEVVQPFEMAHNENQPESETQPEYEDLNADDVMAETAAEEDSSNAEIASIALDSNEDAKTAIEALEAELSRPPVSSN